jgi:hypothetical protein
MDTISAPGFTDMMIFWYMSHCDNAFGLAGSRLQSWPAISFWPTKPGRVVVERRTRLSRYRFTGDVAACARARDDSTSPLLLDLDKTGLQVGVKAGPATLFEDANLIDVKISDFEPILNRDPVLA